MQRIPNSSHDGFTLLETVVATGVLVTALAGIAQLFALSVRSTREAGVQGTALVAAQAKLELLRSLAFTYGPVGEPITDAALASSAGSSLAEDTPGFVDFLDHQGRPVDAADDAQGAAFTRRWRVAPSIILSPRRSPSRCACIGGRRTDSRHRRRMHAWRRSARGSHDLVRVARFLARGTARRPYHLRRPLRRDGGNCAAGARGI